MSAGSPSSKIQRTSSQFQGTPSQFQRTSSQFQGTPSKIQRTPSQIQRTTSQFQGTSSQFQRTPSQEEKEQPDGSQLCSRAITINAPTQEFNDCFVYAIVKILVKLIGNCINIPTPDIPEELPNTAVARVAAIFSNRNGVETVDFEKLPRDLQKWGHLANVLQKYIRKYYSSDSGITLNILTEIIATLNMLSSRYTAATSAAGKEHVITDFLNFNETVDSDIEYNQQITSEYITELLQYLTKSINKLDGIIRFIPPQYANILSAIVVKLTEYYTLLSSIDTIRHDDALLEQTEETVRDVTTQATPIQTNLDTMITDIIKLLTELDPEQTNLILLLTQLKTTVTALLPNIKQIQEIYGSVTQSEIDAVIPIFEHLFGALNGLQFEVNPRDIQFDIQQQQDKFEQFSRKLTEIRPSCELSKLKQLCKTLLFGNYAHLSIKASDAWFKLFSEVYRDAESVQHHPNHHPTHTTHHPTHHKTQHTKHHTTQHTTQHTSQHTICTTTDPYIFISDIRTYLLFKAINDHAVNLSGHAVVIKGIKIIDPDVYFLIENSWGPTWPACWVNIKVFGTFVESGQSSCLMTTHYSINVVSTTRQDTTQLVDLDDIDVDIVDEPCPLPGRKHARDEAAACANSCEERIVTVWDLNDRSFGFTSNVEDKSFRFTSDVKSKKNKSHWLTKTTIYHTFKKYESATASAAAAATATAATAAAATATAATASDSKQNSFGGSTRRIRPKSRLCATRRQNAHKQCITKQNTNNRRRPKTSKTAKNKKNRKNALRKTRK